MGCADVVCDLVSTGNTLIANDLKEVEVVLNSEALLVGNEFLVEEKQSILNELMFKINYNLAYA
jgi:ATP phosphoribosyltransferase